MPQLLDFRKFLANCEKVSFDFQQPVTVGSKQCVESSPNNCACSTSGKSFLLWELTLQWLLSDPSDQRPMPLAITNMLHGTQVNLKLGKYNLGETQTAKLVMDSARCSLFFRWFLNKGTILLNCICNCNKYQEANRRHGNPTSFFGRVGEKLNFRDSAILQ